MIADYARHLDYLATCENKRRQLSQGALKRCRDFTWNAKMEVINRLYAAEADKA